MIHRDSQLSFSRWKRGHYDKIAGFWSKRQTLAACLLAFCSGSQSQGPREQQHVNKPFRTKLSMFPCDLLWNNTIILTHTTMCKRRIAQNGIPGGRLPPTAGTDGSPGLARKWSSMTPESSRVLKNAWKGLRKGLSSLKPYNPNIYRVDVLFKVTTARAQSWFWHATFEEVCPCPAPCKQGSRAVIVVIVVGMVWVSRQFSCPNLCVSGKVCAFGAWFAMQLPQIGSLSRKLECQNRTDSPSLSLSLCLSLCTKVIKMQ